MRVSTVLKDPARRVYLALIVAALLYSPMLFSGLDQYGRRDWDQFTFRYETPRVALLRDHQWPLWNPYVNGGTVLMAHPDSPFPSPWYLPVLVMGAETGLRVQVVLFLMIGAVGMAVLLRHWQVAAPGAFVGGVVFMMSAHFALHIAEGHLEWCVLGLMPWVVLATLRAADDRRFILIAGLLLSSALMFGSVYILAVYLPVLSVWAALESLRRRSWRLGLAWGAAVVLMVALSAVKLLPQFEFTQANPRPPKVAQAGLSLRGLATAFIHPQQADLYRAMRDVEADTQARARGVVNGHKPSAPIEVSRPVHQRLRAQGAVDEWHEYGAYITLIGLGLAICGLLISWRRQWPLYAGGAVAAVVTVSNASPVDLWALLQRLPFYESLTVPSRFLAVVVFVLAVSAGYGLGWLCRLAQNRRWLRIATHYVLPGIVFVELAMMGWSVWGDVFVYPRVPLAAHQTFATRFDRLDTNYPGMYSYTVPLIAANSGAREGYENIQVSRGAVRTATDPGYRGEAYLDSGASPVTITNWTMSAVGAKVRVAGPERLVLNQNFFAGWRARIRGTGGAVREQVATPTLAGLVSVALYEGDTEATVYYWPNRLAAGAWVSGLGWVGCVAVLIAARRTAPRDGARGLQTPGTP